MTVYLCRVPFAIAGQGTLGDPGSESPLSVPELGIRKLQLAAASGDTIEETSVYLDMSKVYLRLRKLEQCRALVKKALDLSIQSGNKDQLADAHNCMANVLLETMKASRRGMPLDRIAAPTPASQP